MSVSWDPPTKPSRASERGETAIQRDRPSSFSGCRGKPINPTSQLLHYLACHSFPSLRPPQHTSYSLLPQTAPPKSLIRPLEQPPAPATKAPFATAATPEPVTNVAARTACHPPPPRRRHCALSVPLDRRRDYTVFASTALCRPEPEQTHCDGPVRGHEVNGRWPLLYPFPALSDGAKQDQSCLITTTTTTAAGPSPSAPLIPPPSQLRLLNRDPGLLRSRRAVLSVDPVRECLAF